jgi:hypothetical protein
MMLGMLVGIHRKEIYLREIRVRGRTKALVVAET